MKYTIRQYLESMLHHSRTGWLISGVILVLMLVVGPIAMGQSDTAIYHLVIEQSTINITGKNVMGMTVNGSTPGPTLVLKEGGYAIIYVENKMDEETSVHWHGLILPNFFDGVPYLTTPPIQPGETFRYEFPLQQSGTYWYHSHTMLQEQSGVYGSIIIEPKKQTFEYDKDLVLVLSDWTNQKPVNVLRNLKRGNEWYDIKKKTATPLSRVIARGGGGAQVKFWSQRMDGADIADVYYNAFLTNGKTSSSYPDLVPGEKVRVRFINAAASSQYWVTFGGESPLLVSADGLDVVPILRDKFFIGIAETYDFIVTVPISGQMEIRAMAQDGSGNTFAYLGIGDTLFAPVLPRPDKIEMMKKMAKMDMRMGAPATKFMPKKEQPKKLMQNWGMKMDKKKKDEKKHGEGMDMPDMHHMDGKKSMPEMDMDMNMFAEYNYDYLKSPEKTTLDSSKPVKEVLLNLTGNMWRYIWSLNGVPLSETDKIEIKQGEVVRITLNNLTMMHHPMHLHGHFFRVVNEHGEYSPLKHTVNVPPMQKVVIEFDASEYGDWFFHCHVLYHMTSGMARIFSYDTIRDPRMTQYPLKKLTNESKHFYTWGTLDAASHMAKLSLTTSNSRNQFNFKGEYGWNKNLETELSYEYYLYDYFRVFGGINVENENRNSLNEISATAVVGFRYFTRFMFNLDVRMDSKLRPQIGLSRSFMLFPRTIIFGEIEYQSDFGLVNDLRDSEGNKKNYDYELVWSAGMKIILTRNISLFGSYDNRFGAGGGLSVMF